MMLRDSTRRWIPAIALLTSACAPTSSEVTELPVVLRSGPEIPREALDFDGERRLSRVTQLTRGARVLDASFDERADRVLFSDVRDGQRCPQVLVMDVDGYDARKVSAGGGTSQGALFVPRSSRIAYASTRAAGDACAEHFGVGRHLPPSLDLVLANEDAEEVTPLANSPAFDGDLAFDATGDTFAFATARDGDLEIYTGSLDEPDALTRRTERPGYDAQPAISPDGKRLVWVQADAPEDAGTFAKALAAGSARATPARLMMLDLEAGGEPIALTEAVELMNPSFDASGERVLFSARIDDAAGDLDIYMVSDLTKKVPNLERITFHPADDVAATMNRDGTRVVIVSARNASRAGEHNVFVADWEARPEGAERRLRGQAALDATTWSSRIERLPKDRVLGTPELAAAEAFFAEQLAVAGAMPAPERKDLLLPYVHEVTLTQKRLDVLREERGGARCDFPMVVTQGPPVESKPEPESSGVEEPPPAPEVRVCSGTHVIGYLPARDSGPTPESIALLVRLNHTPAQVSSGVEVAAILELVEALAASERARDVYVVGFSSASGRDGTPPEVLDALGGRGLVGALEFDGTYLEHSLVMGERSGRGLVGAIRRAQSGLDHAVVFNDSVPESGARELQARGTPAAYMMLPDTPSPAALTLAYRVALDLVNAPHAYPFQNPLQASLRERVARERRASAPARDVARATERAHSGGYGTYLGTVPGFAKGEVAGALVRDVTPGSPAEAAGLKAGDVIVSLDGEPIRDLRGLAAALRAHAPGDVVPIVVSRDGEDVTLEATLKAKQ